MNYPDYLHIACRFSYNQLLLPLTVLPKPCSKPHILEIGCGHGEFLIHLAKQHPDTHIWGIELRDKRATKIAEKVKRAGLTNVTILSGNAHYVVPIYLRYLRFETVYINFPDPWPKRGQAANRLLNQLFLEELGKHLIPTGYISLVTDDPRYAENVKKESHHIASLTREDTDHNGIFMTHYGRRWAKMGRRFHAMQWTISHTQR